MHAVFLSMSSIAGAMLHQHSALDIEKAEHSHKWSWQARGLRNQHHFNQPVKTPLAGRAESVELCAAATAAAERAQEAAEEQASSGSAIAEELDEFGRDLGLMRRQEEAERAAKRKQRAAARKAAIVQTVQVCFTLNRAYGLFVRAWQA